MTARDGTKVPRGQLGPFDAAGYLVVPESVVFQGGESGLGVCDFDANHPAIFSHSCIDARIEWYGRGWSTRKPQPRLLESFVERFGAERVPDLGREVVRFAEKWGPLGLCVDNLPEGHEDSRRSFRGEQKCAGRRMINSSVLDASWEPIEAWRKIACQARALIALGARLREDTLGRPEDWALLFDSWIWPDSFLKMWGFAPAPAKPRRRSVRKEREVVASALQFWLEYGRVTPTVSWQARRFSHPTDRYSPEPQGTRPTTTLGSPLLFGHRNCLAGCAWPFAACS